MQRPFVFLCIFFFTALALALGSCSSEPREKDSDATAEPIAAKASIADVEKGIRAYIQEQTEQGDGYFYISDDTLDLKLRLVRVHTEYLSVLRPGNYFACVDLADTTGDVYDVDFFLSGTPDDMKVIQTTVHKHNGRPFYTWEQQADKTWTTVPVKSASNHLLGVIEGKDEFEFYYQTTVPEFSGKGKMWIPIATSDRYQEVEVLSMDHPGIGKTVTDQPYGNRILFLELSPEDAGKPIRIDYKVTRLEKSPYPADTPDALYTATSPLSPVGGRFYDIAAEILEGKTSEGELEKARAIYDYVVESVRYAKQGTYGTGDANFACDEKSGNCTEFHSLFISLARSAGIPTRFAIGAAIPSNRDEGGMDGYHCWAEFYAEGKWWPVDISEANKYSDLATYYFGHHPANRFQLSRGRDLKVIDGPREGTIPFLAFPYFEAENEARVIKATFEFSR